jgi:periplasmic divalent cation tolerance protein
VILCTVPDEATAQKLARGLVEERLAACVNAIPGVKSFYRWQGKLQADTEIQLIIKTRSERFDELAAWISTNHPYEVPEIIAIPADRVSNDYLAWAVDQTS